MFNMESLPNNKLIRGRRRRIHLLLQPSCLLLLSMFLVVTITPYTNAFVSPLSFVSQSHGTSSTLFLSDSNNTDTNTNSNLLISEDTLTLEDLTWRFTQVLDHYKTTQELSNEQVCHSMLRTRLADLQLHRCHVQPSTIVHGGQGLFASKTIRKGDLITLYPGDALLLWSKTVGDFTGNVTVLFGKHVALQDANTTRVCSDEARNYEIKIQPNASIVGDEVLKNDPSYLGHMINDGAICRETSMTARQEYKQKSLEKHNAAIVSIKDCHYAVMATKDIEANDEIFVSYGEGYWLSRLQLRSKQGKSTTGSPPKPGNVKKDKGKAKQSLKRTNTKGFG